MRVVDLTLDLRSGIRGLPGSELHDRNPTKVEAIAAPNEEQMDLYRREGRDVAPDAVTGYLASVSRLTTTTHTGTHIDAPRHFFAEKASIDRVPLERLVSKALMLDLTHKGADAVILPTDLDEVGERVDADVIPVVHTGWTDRMWGKPDYDLRMPYCGPGVGEWFLERGVKAVAFDCYNDLRPWAADQRDVDPDAPPQPLHNALLGNGVVLIENLVNLNAVRAQTFLLVALPLKLLGADGAPARVIGIEDVS